PCARRTRGPRPHCQIAISPRGPRTNERSALSSSLLSRRVVPKRGGRRNAISAQIPPAFRETAETARRSERAIPIAVERRRRGRGRLPVGRFSTALGSASFAPALEQPLHSMRREARAIVSHGGVSWSGHPDPDR